MKPSYLILVNGVLWDQKLTEAGALQVCQFLRLSGLKAEVKHEVCLQDGEVE